MTKLALAIAIAFLASSYAHAATVIARYDYSAGFSIRPGSEFFEVYDNGAVQFHSEYYNRESGKNEIRDYKLAQLNREQIKALANTLRPLKAKDLIDEDEGQARCADAPSSEYSIFKSGNKVVIHREASCHTWVNYNAAQVKTVLQGLAALAKF